MNVLIAGGSGLIGRELVKQLLEAGDQPLVLTRQPEGGLKFPAGVQAIHWERELAHRERFCSRSFPAVGGGFCRGGSSGRATCDCAHWRGAQRRGRRVAAYVAAVPPVCRRPVWTWLPVVFVDSYRRYRRRVVLCYRQSAGQRRDKSNRPHPINQCRLWQSPG